MVVYNNTGKRPTDRPTGPCQPGSAQKTKCALSRVPVLHPDLKPRLTDLFELVPQTHGSDLESKLKRLRLDRRLFVFRRKGEGSSGFILGDTGRLIIVDQSLLIRRSFHDWRMRMTENLCLTQND